jgi:hypothetical protein
MAKNNGSKWSTFLDAYSAMNAGRPTRLGVFELNDHVVNDYWIEDGLPLVALKVRSADASDSVEILAGDMTHVVDNAVKLVVHLTSSGHEDGLDIFDRHDRVTILRFEI